MAWIIRALIFMGGLVAGLFVSQDSNTYPIASLIAALLILTLFISIWAFWPALCRFVRNATRKQD